MKLFFCNITEFSDEEFNRWFDAMDHKRKQSVSRLKSENKQKLRIAADYLRRSAIADFCGVPADSIIFLQNEHGKPYAEDLPVHFSISHSGDMVACAVSDKEIGIDVEKIREINPRSAERFANTGELEYIRNSQNGFFEIWTLKEAFFKCIGTGLSSDIKNVSFKIDKTGILCSESGFDLSFCKVNKDYICSVCEKKS